MGSLSRSFLDDALHELNRRVGALAAEASMLGECLDEVAGEARRPAELLIHDVDQLRVFLQRLGALLRIDRVTSTETENFDVVQLAHEIRAGLTRRGSVTISGPDTATAAGPREPIAQAMTLLVENALVHGGGNARLSIQSSDDGIYVELCDRGPGLPPALATDPFDPFATARAGGTGGGSGLSLALAHALLRSAKAPLVYRAAEPGACFEFTLRR